MEQKHNWIEKNIPIYEQLNTPQENYTWVQISKKAIEHNITQYKKVIGDGILAPVIKSNAYGHGLIETAQICEKNKQVGWLCVATISEALLLRKNNITKPILVLSYLGGNLEQAIIQNISLTAYDMNTIKKLNNIGQQLGKKCNIHIKIDTGLSRLGVQAKQAVTFIQEVKIYKFIHIQGIWTQFAESDTQDRSFTNQQLQLFENIAAKLEEYGIHIPIKHVANSAATTTLHLQNAKYGNFFRVGLGLYGYWPSEYVKKITQKTWPDFTLKPAMTWKTKIFHIKHIKKNNFIGYNREYQVTRDSKIALVPTGYFDGYDLRLSNKSFVLIHRKHVPTVGRICMNITTIDVTDIKEVNVGDEVILLGDYPYINSSSIAQTCNPNPREIMTEINAEIMTKINAEIPRIIVD